MIVWQVLKVFGGPGTLTFLFLGVVIGLTVAFVWPRKPRLGHAWLAILMTSYLAMALPLTAEAIATGLPRTGAMDEHSVGPLGTLVVLDGDNRRGRVRSAVDVYKASKPHDVLVLGSTSTWLRDALVSGGIPSSSVEHDPTTPNTREQIARVEQTVVKHTDRVGLIASRLQMPRILALTRARGVSVVPIASPIDDEPPTSGLALFVPTYIALRVSRDAIYEHAALAYYGWRGWLHQDRRP